jgi:hypothetical protein
MTFCTPQGSGFHLPSKLRHVKCNAAQWSGSNF